MQQLTWRNWLRTFYQAYCLSLRLLYMAVPVQQTWTAACESLLCCCRSVGWDWPWGAWCRHQLLLSFWTRGDWAARTMPCSQAHAGLPDLLPLCPLSLPCWCAAWEPVISFNPVHMHSPFCLAELSCITWTNTLMQLSGESLASEVAIRHFTGFSKVFEYLSEQTQDNHSHNKVTWNLLWYLLCSCFLTV